MRQRFDAVKAVAELSPDLVFLDMQMPKLNGFEVLELIGRSVPVIFTTAMRPYALRFEVHAVDYLLKPFSEERFAEALSRARARLAAPAPGGDIDALIADARPRQGAVERVLIRDGSQVHVLPVEKIDYVEAQDDYVCFKSEADSTEGSDHGRARGAARSGALMRIHRSSLLNIERIAKVELYAKDSRVAILRDGAVAGEPGGLRTVVELL